MKACLPFSTPEKDADRSDELDMDDLFITESELRHWLSIEDWYMSSHTRDWLNRTSITKASDVLADIAEDANLEPNQPFAAIAMAMIVTGFTPSSAIAGAQLNNRKAGIRAAIHLGAMNDARSIPPLCRCWTGGGWRQSKYHAEIESSLTRLLEHFADEDSSKHYFSEVQDLILNVWNSSRLSSDLPPSRTKLLQKALLYLKRGNRITESSPLQLIVASSSRKPNRQLVQEEAKGLFVEKLGIA